MRVYVSKEISKVLHYEISLNFLVRELEIRYVINMEFLSTRIGQLLHWQMGAGFSCIGRTHLCSWGERPRKAAQIAIKTIQDYIKPLIGSISTTQQAANALLCGFRRGT